MNHNELLIGCGKGQMTFDEQGYGTGLNETHNFYSIINFNTASVVKSGWMSKSRQHYGLVKIKHMYYAVLGVYDNYPDNSIDIYNHNSGMWEEINVCRHNWIRILALHYQDFIYAKGMEKTGKIFKFDPSCS